jgi:hypothetical protein
MRRPVQYMIGYSIGPSGEFLVLLEARGQGRRMRYDVC